MMQHRPLVLSDGAFFQSFLPLTFTRPVAALRCGILTFAERWQKLLNAQDVYYLTEEYLQQKYPAPAEGPCLMITPNFLPTEGVLAQIKNLQPGHALVYRDELLAACVDLKGFSLSQIEQMHDVADDLVFFRKTTDLFSLNGAAIDFDFELLTKGRQSQPLSPTNGHLGKPEDLFIEEGAVVEYSTLNCKSGKIYIGKNAEIMEGCHVRGPLALGEGSKLNLGAKVYGPTTIGPHCKIGGEVNNIVVLGYSNKGHDGFVGNSVIGEWCNLGADTNSSNLKNNYATVKLYDYETRSMKDSGLQFAGVIMGDHTKTAINTQLNTGTTIGVASNIFHSDFPPTYIPSFSWGGREGDPVFQLDKALEVAERVMARRGIALTQEDTNILKHVFAQDTANVSD